MTYRHPLSIWYRRIYRRCIWVIRTSCLCPHKHVYMKFEKLRIYPSYIQCIWNWKNTCLCLHKQCIWKYKISCIYSVYIIYLDPREIFWPMGQMTWSMNLIRWTKCQYWFGPWSITWVSVFWPMWQVYFGPSAIVWWSRGWIILKWQL